jgi:glycosyltransferase involved in cell wall biosynthesis
MDTNLTICIPAYNASDYIEKTIQSLLRQTYNNFLIIVGDNASTDETAEIIEHLAKKENRIKLIRNPYNLGFADNINNLASTKAESPYIAIFPRR